jgi:ABC-type antimicrobial peptide transport system ATPase subunit
MRPFQAIGEKPIIEKFQEAADAANEFVRFYKSNEILFNSKTCKLFEKINESFLKAWKDFRRARQFGQTASPELSQEIVEKEMDAYYKTLLKEIPELKEELKDDFRNILGVEKE